MFDVEKICRACLTSNWPQFSLHNPISYTSVDQERSHLECLKLCLRQDVPTNGSEYPLNICIRCSKALQVAYHFIVMAELSETKLQAALVTSLTSSNMEIQEEDINEEHTEELQLQLVEKTSRNGFSNDPHIMEPMQNYEYSAVGNEMEGETKNESLLILEDNLKEDCSLYFEYAVQPLTEAKHCSSIRDILNVIENQDIDKNNSNDILTNSSDEAFQEDVFNGALDVLSQFNNEEELQKPSVSLFKCFHCKFTTNKEEPMRSHIKMKHKTFNAIESHFLEEFKCSDCDRYFKSIRNMRTHFTFMHGTSKGKKKSSSDIFVCEYCDKQFFLKSSLTAHQRACRCRKAVSCYKCEQTFTSLRKFGEHLRQEHDIQTIHECEICGKRFKTSVYLAIHRKRHMERHFHCELCNSNYVHKSELKKHIERIHGNGAKSVCQKCNATFKSYDLLRGHMNTVHNVRHKCSQCDNTFTSRYRLRIHQFTHTGEKKPYKCPVCEKEFSFRSVVRRHAEERHGIVITNDDLAEMFRNKFGYPSRYDAFSSESNTLFITDVNEDDVDNELQEFDLHFDDLYKEMFAMGIQTEDLISN